MPQVTNQKQFRANFRYFGDLPTLLKRNYRHGLIAYHFNGHPAVKDAIETMGIPHTEVDIILANGNSVGFDHPLHQDDLIEVYPPHAEVLVCPCHFLSSTVTHPACFILDVHLGKLARRLRLLGFDCLYRNDFADSDILRIALDEGRIILTRDLGILKHRQVAHGCLIRADQVDVQVREVLDRYRLYEQIKPWRRCLNCNGLLRKVDKEAVKHLLEAKTRLYYEDFRQCTSCDQLYWQGSHCDKISRWLAALPESSR